MGPLHTLIEKLWEKFQKFGQRKCRAEITSVNSNVASKSWYFIAAPHLWIQFVFLFAATPPVSLQPRVNVFRIFVKRFLLGPLMVKNGDALENSKCKEKLTHPVEWGVYRLRKWRDAKCQNSRSRSFWVENNTFLILGWNLHYFQLCSLAWNHYTHHSSYRWC